MKKFLFIITIISLLIGCDTEKRKAEKEKQAMQLSIDKAAESQQLIDTICFGFRFSMTSDELYEHCEKLLNENKIYIDDNSYNYDFHLIDNHANLKDNKVNVTFDADFYNNKLYCFRLNFDIKSSLPEAFQSIPSFYDVARMDIANVLMCRYFSENIFHINRADPFVIVNKNLVIELKQYSGTYATATFTNMPIVKMIAQQQENEKREKAKKTFNDL